MVLVEAGPCLVAVPFVLEDRCAWLRAFGCSELCLFSTSFAVGRVRGVVSATVVRAVGAVGCVGVLAVKMAGCGFWLGGATSGVIPRGLVGGD